ncbi:MAG TPA: NTPase [Candidatus Udaeobacter sp.]|nr:NTPase [Candidatus Udaeobacter sp.]
MTARILLTGRPGCGKTTLIKRIVSDLAMPAGGFYTEEIRERGRRLGFKLVTLDGNEAVFAHVNFKTSERLGKYGLDLSALEATGVQSIHAAMHARRLVVIDEIGPMEIRSATFRDAVNEAFDNDVPILATIVARSLPFTDAIKKRSDVSTLEVHSSNRQELLSTLRDEFKNLSSPTR